MFKEPSYLLTVGLYWFPPNIWLSDVPFKLMGHTNLRGCVCER